MKEYERTKSERRSIRIRICMVILVALSISAALIVAFQSPYSFQEVSPVHAQIQVERSGIKEDVLIRQMGSQLQEIEMLYVSAIFEQIGKLSSIGASNEDMEGLWTIMYQGPTMQAVMTKLDERILTLEEKLNQGGDTIPGLEEIRGDIQNVQKILRLTAWANGEALNVDFAVDSLSIEGHVNVEAVK